LVNQAFKCKVTYKYALFGRDTWGKRQGPQQ